MKYEPSFSPGESSGKACPTLTLIKVAVCESNPIPLQNVGTGLQALTAGPLRNESAAILRRQKPVGVGGKQHSVSILTDAEVDSLEDTDLQRYLSSLARAINGAKAVWESDGCFDAHSLAVRLWSAEQVALRVLHHRPHLGVPA
jgi:hypothetical protein